MSAIDNFNPHPSINDFWGKDNTESLITIDQSDIFWCLSQKGFDSFVTEHSGIFFSPIESMISGCIIDSLVDLAKKKECEECIDCILKEHSRINEIEIDLFDLLMREYVWQMGKICYKLRSNIMPALRGLFVGLFTSRSVMEEFEYQYNKKFINVYKELNRFSYIILTNLIEPHRLLSKDQYQDLICKYVTDSHVKFENLEAPNGHTFEGLSFIDIIFKGRDVTSKYYMERYKNYASLYKGFTGDYPENFYHRPSPIGNDKIYE